MMGGSDIMPAERAELARISPARPVPAAGSPPLRLIVPAGCQRCHGLEIAVSSAVERQTVMLYWRCRTCLHQWPVMPAESDSTERRQGRRDRRGKTRADRRQGER
jgi:hypothetical protein